MNEPQTQIYEFDGFRVDVAKRLLTKAGGGHLPLTPKVFETLLYLIRHGGRVIEKDELMRAIWTDSVVEENNLNQNISTLRRVLGEKPGEQRFIVTVAGRGYRFVPEVRPVLDRGCGVTETEAGETVPESAPGGAANLVTNGEGQQTADGHPARNRKSGIRHRGWLAALALVCVLALGVAGFYRWRGGGESAGSPSKTVAVLPFKPLVTDNRNEALELGMADALISKLSGGAEIVVRPLSAVRRYNSVEQDALAAGRELGVESILDGTIQTWGNRIRISAKLLRTSDGQQLWAGQFDEKFDDILVVQDSISGRVAAALKIRLGGKEKQHPTENIEAFQLYMKGRYHIAKGTPPDLRASIPYFQQAIDLDPEYALAYTGLSQAYGVLGIAGEMSVAEAFTKAQAAGRKALEIDDTLGEAHVALCMGAFWYEWDWHAAEKACLRETSELEPNFWLPHLFAASAYIEKGMYAEAIAASRKEYELSGRNDLPFGAYALAKSGKRDEARAALQELLSSSATRHVSPYNIALIYNALEMRDHALEWLGKGYEQRDPKMTFLKVEPKWNNLRSEPRFVDLMKQMNFQQ